MSKARITLAGSIVTRNENPIIYPARDQSFQNCFAELTTNPLSGKSTVYLHKRQGLVATALDSTSGYTGMMGSCVWTGYSSGPQIVFAFFKTGTGARVNGTVSGLIGAVITGSYRNVARLSETTIDGVANLTAIIQDTSGIWHAWYIAEGSGSWTEITNANYPINQTPALATVGEMIHMDGYPFIMDSMGKIWNGDLNSLSAWSATSFIQAQFSPDGGVGLAKSGGILWAFGRASIEPFRNTGNPSGSPLSRVSGGAKNIGAYSGVVGGSVSRKPIASVGDDIYFIGLNSSNGGVGVYVIRDAAIKKISTQSIDRILANNLQGASKNANILGSFTDNGLTHVMVELGQSSQIWCYCVESNFWWQYISAPLILACAGYAGASYFNTGDAAPALYETFWPSPYQDNGVAYSSVVRTSLIDGGNNNRKFWESATLIGDRQSIGATTEILWSDDDYSTTLTQQNNFLNLPGSSGDYASTPDSAALDITGGIDIVCYAAATDWTPASNSILVSKWLSAGNQRSYQIVLFTTGMVGLMVSTLGTAASVISGNSSVAIGAADGEGRWLRFTRDVVTGAVNIYTSTDAPNTALTDISWSQLGTPIATTAGAAFSSAAELEVGGNNAGAGTTQFIGKIYSAYVYDGIGGTLVASFRISDASPRSIILTSTLTGEVWTLNGNAAVIAKYGVDMSAALPKMTRLGSSRRRSFEITDSANRPWRVEALELEYSEATG